MKSITPKIPDLGIHERSVILKSALYIEGFVSYFLAALLGIKDAKNSICFGNKSSALSFNQKINLLIDINILNKTDRKKFVAFMEIRNQFMHNIEAKTYESCLSFTNQTTFLLRTYPQDSRISKETQLKNAVSELLTDVGEKSLSIWKKVEDKIEKEIESKQFKKYLTVLESSIGEAPEIINNLFNKIFDEKNLKIRSEDEKFGLIACGIILKIAKDKLKE